MSARRYVGAMAALVVLTLLAESGVLSITRLTATSPAGYRGGLPLCTNSENHKCDPCCEKTKEATEECKDDDKWDVLSHVKGVTKDWGYSAETKSVCKGNNCQSQTINTVLGAPSACIEDDDL